MKPRILVLTPRFPYPVIGGDRLRIHAVCRALSQRYELTLLSLCEDDAELYIQPSDQIFSSIERVLLPKWQSWLNCLAALATRTPLQVAYYRSARFRQKYEALIGEHDFVLCHLVRTAEYARNAPVPRVLEMTDAISLNYSRVRKTASRASLRTWIYEIEQTRLLEYERGAAEAFDLTVLVSDVDSRHLVDHGVEKDRLSVCGNGVDTVAMPYQFTHGSKRIVFIGNMTTLQNLDAAYWFGSQVMPLLLAKVPEARFEVVGRIGAEETRRLSKLPGVHVIGAVKSVPEAVRGAAVGVCPMRLGAGVQNKMLEYLALGLPTVSSPVGLEGLAADVGKDLLLAYSSQEYADTILRLFSDDQHAEFLAKNGRALVEQKYSWDAQLAPLINKFEEISNNAN